jgi:hypothetical protein
MATSPSGGGEQGYSSLREAVNRILGSPAGGEGPSLGFAGGATGAQPQTSEIQLGTKSAVENTPFEDPNTTAQKKALADAQATTAQMQAQLAGLTGTGSTGTAATPAAAAAAAKNPWDKPAVAASINKGFFYDPASGQVQVGGMWGSPDAMTVVNPTNINDPGIYHTMDWAIGTRYGSGYGAGDPATEAAVKIWKMASPATQQAAFNEYGKYYSNAPQSLDRFNPGSTSQPAAQGGQSAAMAATSAAEAARGKGGGGGMPTRPTGKITWQQDQQYWRDLDNYNKANKLGAYK